MRAAVITILSRPVEIFSPPTLKSKDHDSVILAIARQRVARIAQLATFVFATATTIALATLTEASILTGVCVLPVLLTCFVAWAIFIRLHKLDNAYLSEADTALRQELAKKRLEKLLFETTLEDLKDFEKLHIAFTHINILVDVDIFTTQSLQRFNNLKFGGSKTLIEVALEQDIPLTLDLKGERYVQGRFGNNSINHSVNIQWDGNKGNPISVVMETTFKDIYGKPLPQ